MKLNNNAIFRLKQCVKYSNSAPAIRKIKTNSNNNIIIISRKTKTEHLKKNKKNRVKIDEHIFFIDCSVIVVFARDVGEWAVQIAKKNATNLQFIFKSHWDQRVCACICEVQILWMYFNAVLTTPAHSKRLKLLLTNSTFYDQTCCFIRSRAWTEHSVPVRRENFFRNVIIIFRVRALSLSLPLLLLWA